MEKELSPYWEKKLKKVCKISKQFDYPEQDREFWERKPAGIISLIVDIYDSKIK